MTSRWTQNRSSGLGFFAQLATLSPLRYGVVTVIVITLGYTSIRIVPMIHRDLELLKNVYAVDERGISLAATLQSQIQESRRQYLNILSSQAKPAEFENKTRSMQQYDSTIALTESSIAELGANSGDGLQQFRRSWLRYVTRRDEMIASLKGRGGGEHQVDADTVNAAFLEVEQAVRTGEAAFEAASTRQTTEISDTLRRTLR